MNGLSANAPHGGQVTTTQRGFQKNSLQQACKDNFRIVGRVIFVGAVGTSDTLNTLGTASNLHAVGTVGPYGAFGI